MTENNTAKSFSDKWHRNVDLAFSNTLDPNSDIFRWIGIIPKIAQDTQ